ncbi:hypothetical protein K493DRAFT_335698 [Basidiobolus meristosporus CBS 931.73]|uniref:RNA polymerase II subunit B1 CTD phosphatase RPAP2 homolog n=1 Tax=Basidiobolus meristosporus CBS 931.73 TaxID=1314790 RepID=A0A1Y1YNK7_9FUNG|nr:hypothetical protein K493DRAFT_335698 [Basidiobolus meristosporus CBS 931.73]|eukprot:ORX99582.1 hypothetical protein K493DRAFT_335698 [Basidiobolus meristosporus CBS 931.73]
MDHPDQKTKASSKPETEYAAPKHPPNSHNFVPLPQKKKKSGKNKANQAPKPLNRRQKIEKSNLELKRQMEITIMHWQEKLFAPGVNPELLAEAARFFRPVHFEEIVEERNSEFLCGYPLCSQPCQDIKGKYHISLEERKLYDMTELRSYCSGLCMTAAKFYLSQLSDEAVYLRDLESWGNVKVIPLGHDASSVNLPQRMSEGLGQELLSNYVKSMIGTLQLPQDGLVIKENNPSEQEKNLLAQNLHLNGANFDAVDGFSIQTTGDRQTPSTDILPKAKASVSIDPDVTEHNTSIDSFFEQADLARQLAEMELNDNTNVEQKSTSRKPKKSSKAKKPKPTMQLSLFGKLWTFLDKCVTTDTRQYMKSLRTEVPFSMCNLVADTDEEHRNLLRQNMLSEKMISTLSALRAEYRITTIVENELIGLVGTLVLDESMVVLDPAEDILLCTIFLDAISRYFPSLDREMTEASSSIFGLLEPLGVNRDKLNILTQMITGEEVKLNK